MHWRREVWRLGICKGLAFRSAFDWSDPDSNAKVSGLPDGFQWIDTGEHCGVQFIEFADDAPAQCGLVQQHWRIACPRAHEGEALNRSVLAEILSTIEDVAERKAPLQRSQCKQFHHVRSKPLLGFGLAHSRRAIGPDSNS